MSRKAKTNGSTALATIATAPSALQIKPAHPPAGQVRDDERRQQRCPV